MPLFREDRTVGRAQNRVRVGCERSQVRVELRPPTQRLVSWDANPSSYVLGNGNKRGSH